MKYILVYTILFLLTVSSVFAQTIDYCSNNSTLTHLKQATINVPERNITRTFNVTENETCVWGCQNNECLSPPWIAWAMVLGMVIIGFIIIGITFSGSGGTEKGLAIIVGFILMIVFLLMINSLNTLQSYKTILYMFEFILLGSWLVSIIKIFTSQEEY